MALTCEPCGGIDIEPTRHRDVLGTGLNLVRCRGCGTKFYDGPPPVMPEAYYAGEAYDRYSLRAIANGSACNTDPAEAARFESAARSMYEVYIDKMSEYAAPIRVLYDVGFGLGRFLAMAIERGIVAYGCDMNRVDVTEGAKTGATVEFSAFQKATVPHDLDAVVMLDVIEHTLTPGADIARAHEHLRPGGALLVKTFYDEYHDRLAAEGTFDISKERFASRGMLTTGYFCPISHPFHFDAPVLRALIESRGFRVVYEPLYESCGQVAFLALRN